MCNTNNICINSNNKKLALFYILWDITDVTLFTITNPKDVYYSYINPSTIQTHPKQSVYI
jgi:hypothetical protein